MMVDEQAPAESEMEDNTEDNTEDNEEDQRVIRVYIIKLVSQREHSRTELLTKMAAKNFDSGLAMTVLDQLIEEDYVSDQRYADMLLRSRQAKGCGPRRITQELRQKGVSEGDISALIDESDESWNSLAEQTLIKKCGSVKDSELDLPTKAKLTRFMQYKGFTQTQIQFAFSAIA